MSAVSALSASDQASAGRVPPIVNDSPWAHRGTAIVADVTNDEAVNALACEQPGEEQIPR